MAARYSLCLILCMLVGAPLAANEAPVADMALPALSSPALPSEVDAYLIDVRKADAATATRMARALGRAGGHAVLDVLRRLLGHSDSEARIAALDAVSHVALRSETLAQAVHGIAKKDETGHVERLAAVRTLAAIGDGTDFPLLLTLSADSAESAALRSESFRAMAALSGAKLPYVHSRWTYWWRKQSGRKHALLEKAIVALDEATAEDEVDMYAAVVESLSWLDLPYTASALERWLQMGKPRLRAEAARLTGALRLADLTKRVAALLRRRASDESHEAARTTLESLGYALPIAATDKAATTTQLPSTD